MSLADLELDLDVFAGPFDLLLTLVLREEIDLLEVELAEIVITYIDHLERRGELDLELATEFLVLIAALLELKSRLMLPAEEIDQVELDPGDAAEELLARLLDAHRYRGVAGYLVDGLREQEGHRFRSARLPPSLRRAPLAQARGVYDPGVLGRALGGLLLMPEPINVEHLISPKVTVTERLTHLRTLLRRGRFDFDDAVAEADRVTVAVTLFALLELYKQGELTWTQDKPFGSITVSPSGTAKPASAGCGPRIRSGSVASAPGGELAAPGTARGVA